MTDYTYREEAVGLIQQLDTAGGRNTLKDRYYNGHARLKNMNIGLPPGMENLGAVVDWPRIAIDSVANRTGIQGIQHLDQNANLKIKSVVADNNLLNEVHHAVVDSMVYGVGFLVAHHGDVEIGEPEIIISAESPTNFTCEWDNRKKRVTKAIQVVGDSDDNGVIQHRQYVYFTDDIIAYLDGDMSTIEVYEHGLGFVPVVRIVNNSRGGSSLGKSDITRPLRYFTDAAIRTLIGTEVSREFHASPQRYVLGADEDLFTDEDGNPVPAWESYIGRYVAINGEEGADGTIQKPEVGQFPSNSMEPYLSVLETLSRLAAAAAGVPASVFGLVTSQIPSSADSIRASQDDLIEKCLSKQENIRSAVVQLFRFVFLMSDMIVPDPVTVTLRDPAPYSPSATTDSLTKLIQVGVVSATSDYVYSKLGMTPDEAEVARAEVAKAGTASLLDGLLTARAAEARQEPEVAEINAQTGAGGDSGAVVGDSTDTGVSGDEE